MFNVLNLSRILLSLAVTSLLSSTTIQVRRGTSISVWASRVSSASCSSLHKCSVSKRKRSVCRLIAVYLV